MLCLSYYCLCLLFNKIGEKGRMGSAWKRGGGGGEGGGGGQGGETAQTMYAHMNKWIKKKREKFLSTEKCTYANANNLVINSKDSKIPLSLLNSPWNSWLFSDTWRDVMRRETSLYDSPVEKHGALCVSVAGVNCSVTFGKRVSTCCYG
jgi:hypothetical protein